MTLRLSIVLALFSSVALAQTAAPPPPPPAPAAEPIIAAPAPAAVASPARSSDDLARRSIDMLAGEAWEEARYIAFTFNVERDGKRLASFPQRWDRDTNDYRVSGTDAKGTAFVVVMNIDTKKGKAWENGNPASGARLEELLKLGYRRFINDTYWLQMPLKMLDPGVHRSYDGERTDACGHAWDVVRLSFDSGLGLTSGDVYWAWINRDTGLVDQWDMKLQGSKADEAPSSVLFRDFRRVGGLLISTRREIKGKNQFILLDEIQVEDEVPTGAFASLK